MKKHTKQYGVYHWDTFDNTTLLVGEKDTLEEARAFVQKHYKGRIRPDGADQVDIVKEGGIVEKYNVG